MSAQPNAARDSDAEELTGPRFTLTYRRDGRERTVDLDEVPDEALPESVRRWRAAQAYAAVEDIRFMAEHGETLAGAAERLTRLRERNVTPDAVERFLHRHGAHELVWKLKAAAVGDPAPDSPKWFLDGRIGDGRSARSKPSPQEAEAARRQSGKGLLHAEDPQPVPSTTLPASPFSRLAHGQPVRGRRL